MEKSIFKYILRFSSRQQIMLTLMAVLSFPVLYIFYELPKQIINGAIQGDPGTFPQKAELFGINFGFSVGHIQWLIILCVLFLVLGFGIKKYKQKHRQQHKIWSILKGRMLNKTQIHQWIHR